MRKIIHVLITIRFCFGFRHLDTSRVQSPPKAQRMNEMVQDCDHLNFHAKSHIISEDSLENHFVKEGLHF